MFHLSKRDPVQTGLVSKFPRAGTNAGCLYQWVSKERKKKPTLLLCCCGCLLLAGNTPFGIINRFVCGAWADKTGDKLTQSLNLIMFVRLSAILGHLGREFYLGEFSRLRWRAFWSLRMRLALWKNRHNASTIMH
jgi:hypothetical protein